MTVIRIRDEGRGHSPNSRPHPSPSWRSAPPTCSSRQPTCPALFHLHLRAQTISMQFTKEQASMRAVTRWALRFGSVVTSDPHQGEDGPETWHRTDFDYFGIAVTAYAHIPAEPADA